MTDFPRIVEDRVAVVERVGTGSVELVLDFSGTASLDNAGIAPHLPKERYDVDGEDR
jgi:hypothetical protein